MSITGKDDIRRIVGQEPMPDVEPDVTLHLGPCGMGMPVILSNAAIRRMEPGQILRTESDHP